MVNEKDLVKHEKLIVFVHSLLIIFYEIGNFPVGCRLVVINTVEHVHLVIEPLRFRVTEVQIKGKVALVMLLIGIN